MLATIRVELPVDVPAVSPRELTGTAALKRGIPPGALGRYTNTGAWREQHNVVAVLIAVVSAAAFSCV